MPFFEDNGRPVAADHRTPPGDIDPVGADAPHRDISLAEVVFRIAASFREGNPLITASSWLYMLRGDDSSMRRRAKQLGVSTAALSRPARILAESFGIRLTDPHIRELHRRLANEAWARRKRRTARKTCLTSHAEREHP
jgi:hypothetical protein